MTELLQTLYKYALETQTLPSAEDRAQYAEGEDVSQRNYEKLSALLSDEGKRHLRNYIESTEALHDLELETVFRAGLSIGQELSRL